MAVKFKLLKQKNLGADKATVPEKIYAREVTTDKITFEYLLEEIAAAGIPSNQVKGVMDRMNFLIRQHLSAGHIVQFGELGNFRYALGSTGSLTEEAFETALIKTPKIVFYPGKTLQKARKNSEFQRLEPAKENEEENGNEEGGF
ncbi:DNA-binding protein [Parabacteroides sp. OttesenSCG-928-K15]|nr:DNA-binding protein [Parabacteroides sp. OttesenSCG-928-K15]